MPDLTAGERAAYKAHIKTLEEQVAWLRNRVDGTVVGATAPAPAPVGPLMEQRLWVSEEEEEIQEMRDLDLIDTDEAEGMLQAIGAMSTDIDFAP